MRENIVQFATILHCENMSVDMTEFNQMEGVEDDYIIEDFFPKSLPEPLQPFIEYRIKLVLKTDTLFKHGESQIVNRTCVIKGKMQSKIGKLSMYLVPYDTLPLCFDSGVYIN